MFLVFFVGVLVGAVDLAYSEDDQQVIDGILDIALRREWAIRLGESALQEVPEPVLRVSCRQARDAIDPLSEVLCEEAVLGPGLSFRPLAFAAVDLLVKEVVLENLTLAVLLAVETAAVVRFRNAVDQRMDNLVGGDVTEMSPDVGQLAPVVASNQPVRRPSESSKYLCRNPRQQQYGA